VIFAENEVMIINGKEFFTIKEMAEITSKERFAIRQALFRAGIEPVSPEALYDESALEFLKNAPPRGRPKKVAAPAKPKGKKSKG